MNGYPTRHGCKRRHAWTKWVGLLLVFAAGVAAFQPSPASTGFPADERASLEASIDRLLARVDPGVELSLWVGADAGPPYFERAARATRASASAIKTAYLVELFDTYADALDQPLPAASAVLSDAGHPAVAHFDAATQQEIHEALGRANVRDVGRMMIRGTGVSNAVYNAAANLTTAVLGGPAGLTARIHRRSPEFSTFAVRRYMLADRRANGDNEVTAAGLAAVLQRVARGDLPGVSLPTLTAIREILLLEEDARGRHFQKSGSLDTDPMTRILSGYWEQGGPVIVYVAMAERAGPGARPRADVAKELQTLVDELSRTLVDAAREHQASLRP